MAELRGRLTLTYGSVSYPVYSVVPKNTEFNYVLMAPVEMVDDSTKDFNIYECTQLFDIVVLGKERGSWNIPNSLATQIMDEVMKKEIVTAHFRSTVYPIIDSINNFSELSEGGMILRKLIRFRYNIQQI